MITGPARNRKNRHRAEQMAQARANYEGVVLTAPMSLPYQRFSNQSAHWWLLGCLREMLASVAVRPDEIDGLTVSSFTLHPDSAVGFAQHSGLDLRWLEHIPMGGASGIVALQRAARAVQCGDANIIACLAGDTNQLDSFRQTLSRFSNFSNDAAWPYGSGGANGYFALLTDYYMRRFDTPREVFGKIAVDQRSNALLLEGAMMTRPLSLEAYLSARMIASPLGLFDCVMPCAGSESFLVMSEETARQRQLPFVRIKAVMEHHNAFASDPVQFRGGWQKEQDRFWRDAGCSPPDMNLIQTYDDYPVISVMQMEDLGFFPKGEAADFLMSRDLTWQGDFPHNTSGGQLSAGQAGAAGGFIGLVEAVRQLTGQAGKRQVAAARLGLVSGFGMVNYDRGVCSGAAVLEGAV
jgi:acetyl-CoA acetyltransferase